MSVVSLSVLLVAVTHAANAVADCATDADCNFAGHCDAGRCNCDPPFLGSSCSNFQMSSFAPSEGGLQIASGNTTWGGSVVRIPSVNKATNQTTYEYHMYAAMMKDNLTLGSWLTHSVVAHAVSTSGLPQGPYKFHDIALDTWVNTSRWDDLSVHNPDAKVLPDGKIVIWYMGTSNRTAPFPKGGNQEEFNQRIGMAWTDNPAGPWQRSEEPVIPAGPKGEWDDGFTCNPAPYVYPNGSVLVIYKARSMEDPKDMEQGVAFASAFDAPYVKLSAKPLDLPTSCEDPGIYRTDTGVFRMLTHCGCAGRYLWSLDGVHWNSTTPDQPWCKDQPIANSNRTVTYNTRQRPKWYVENNTAKLLFTGVNRQGDGGMGHTWTMAASL